MANWQRCCWFVLPFTYLVTNGPDVRWDKNVNTGRVGRQSACDVYTKAVNNQGGAGSAVSSLKSSELVSRITFGYNGSSSGQFVCKCNFSSARARYRNWQSGPSASGWCCGWDFNTEEKISRQFGFARYEVVICSLVLNVPNRYTHVPKCTCWRPWLMRRHGPVIVQCTGRFRSLSIIIIFV